MFQRGRHCEGKGRPQNSSDLGPLSPKRVGLILEGNGQMLLAIDL
jgi:hypothetical protein